MRSHESQRVAANWSSPAAGARYATSRFRSKRAAERDPKLVAAILRDLGVRGRVLDVPCGAGRLHGALASLSPKLAGADVSPEMLAVARESSSASLLRADVEHLPFADRSFDVVVCCRLLHHLHERAQLERVVAELVRVSNRLVVASFWDRASWARLRTRRKSPERAGRVAMSRAAVAECFEAAGAKPLEFRAVFRFISQQTFVVADCS